MLLIGLARKKSNMEIKARGIEGPIVGVTISGFEVTSRMEFWRVPEATAEVGYKRKVWP
jgi:hypothetical protein